MKVGKIIIVGGGFGGVRVAIELAKRGRGVAITLISDKPYFEYYPALYRVVAGYSPDETRIPLQLIFKPYPWVKIVVERVASVDLQARQVRGDRGYAGNYDRLILALGSEPAFWAIPGLADYSYGFASTHDALQLRERMEKLMDLNLADGLDGSALGQIVVIGGGPTGVELVAELATRARSLCLAKGLATNPLTIDLFEAMPRLLPALDPEISERVRERLHRLGINILLNRPVLREEVDGVLMKGMEIKSKTVIWTAGVKPNQLYSQIVGLKLNQRGQVWVDQYLQAVGFKGVYVIGDGAATRYAGMAQTAVLEAVYVARHIADVGESLDPYQPQAPSYAIPVGQGWAATRFRGWKIHGRAGWWLRRAADWRFFFSILPFFQAWRVVIRRLPRRKSVST